MAQEIAIDLGPLRELAGGDESFVSMLLLKIIMDLPGSFEEMEATVGAKDWEGLKKAAHKAKGKFRYLALEEATALFREVEHDAYDLVDDPNDQGKADGMPQKVTDALDMGNRVLAQLQAEHAKLG